MRCLSHQVSCGVLALLCLVSAGAGAAPTALVDRYAGAFLAAGTVLEGPNADSHQVSCRFMAARSGAPSLSLRGACSAYLIISRSISADLAWDPRSGQVTGTYRGARVGTAHLTGTRTGADFDLTIKWPKPLYGDTTAQMRVASLDPDRFRIVVTDRIGVNGPVRATTDLTLRRQ